MPHRRATGSLERLAGAAYGGTQRHLESLFLRWRYGVPSLASRKIDLSELGLAEPSRSGYGPSPWGVLRRVLRRSEVTSEDVFIDFGCGMGRVVLEAARYPFKRVIGVDVAPEFVAVAQSVIDRNKRRLRCQDVELHVADALTYVIPEDVTVAYFANPFSPDARQTVLDGLVASAKRRLRPIRVVYLAPPPLPPLEAIDGIRFVRYGRRRIRWWARADYLALYEIDPASTAETSP